MKGLSIEHGRLTAHSHGGGQDPPPIETPPIDRRLQRNNLIGALSQSALKQECDSLMQHATSSGMKNSGKYEKITQIDHKKKEKFIQLAQKNVSKFIGIGGFSSYLPYMQRPLNFDPPRKRHLRSPFTEQEHRDSVLRDGSKASTGSISPITKGYR